MLNKIIINLNNSKYAGYDNIGPSLIKDVSTVMLDPLVYYIIIFFIPLGV